MGINAQKLNKSKPKRNENEIKSLLLFDDRMKLMNLKSIIQVLETIVIL